MGTDLCVYVLSYTKWKDGGPRVLKAAGAVRMRLLASWGLLGRQDTWPRGGSRQSGNWEQKGRGSLWAVTGGVDC